MKQNICPTCSGLKIVKLILTTDENAIEPNKEIIITSEEFDISFYMSKRSWNDGPWYLQYNIELNGKFDRDSGEYKESCEKLKNLLSYENGWPIHGFSKQITFEDNKGRVFKINEVDSSVLQKDGKFISLSFTREEGYSLESDIAL